MSDAQKFAINLPGTGPTALLKSQWDGCAIYTCFNFGTRDISPLEV